MFEVDWSLVLVFFFVGWVDKFWLNEDDGIKGLKVEFVVFVWIGDVGVKLFELLVKGLFVLELLVDMVVCRGVVGVGLDVLRLNRLFSVDFGWGGGCVMGGGLKVEVVVGGWVCVCIFGGIRLGGRVVGSGWFWFIFCCWIKYIVIVNLLCVRWFCELIFERF